MLEFTLAQDSLPFNYFDELSVSYEETAIDCIQNRFKQLSRIECEKLFNKNIHSFEDILFELNYSDAINDYCTTTFEVDEASGTWGYSNFRISDVKQAKIELEVAARELIEEFVLELSI